MVVVLKEDLRIMLNQGRYHEALTEYGQINVEAEIREMMYHDMADVAHKAAVSFGYSALAREAKRILSCSGSYDEYKSVNGIKSF